MDLLTPGVGLIFWTTLSFIILLILLSKFAWKPILSMVKEREASIADSLNAAEKAKEEVAKLKADNDAIIAEAKLERDRILKEAREIKDSIVAESKGFAQQEADKLIAAAKTAIENEKISAINEIKKQISELSIDIANKILEQELSDNSKYDALINKSVDNLKLN